MKRNLLVAASVVTLACIFAAGTWYGRRTPTTTGAVSGRKVLYYVDPMNPAHTSDKPGKAPCGMDLEPVYADVALVSAPGPELASWPPGTIKVTPEKQQLIGVRLATVEREGLVHNVRLLGRVAVDETRTYRINAAVNGWITRTLPYTTGSYVKKDDTLASFYSPEFLSAMQALLFGLNARDRTLAAAPETSLATMHSNQLFQANLGLQQYRDTLLNLGMGNIQIEDIIRTRRYKKETDVTSPADGFILVRNVSEGLRFEKGTELFRIADLSRVWILVDVFERDATLVQADQPVKVELPNQGKTFAATVSKTLPQFDNISRTLKLRLEVDNPDVALKPEMFVDVELPLRLAEAIVVPAEAVLDAGLRQTVFVDRGNGYFESRNVHIGSRVGDQVQVVQGLTAGELIVTSGTFLLDSESRMKLAAAGVQGLPLTDPVCGMTVDEGKAKAAKRVSEYQSKTYGFCSGGCKKKFDADPTKYLAKGKTPVMTMAAGEPKEVTDPVCGMKVDVAEAKAAKLTGEHQGKTYFFCNEACKKKFDEAPAKYVAAK